MVFKTLKKLRLQLETYWQLGPFNVLRVAQYRLLCRSGYYSFRLPVHDSIPGPFFSEESSSTEKCSLLYFSHKVIDVTSSPDWFLNHWNGKRYQAKGGGHWSETPDFMKDLGDIKSIWEASRFDWLPSMAWSYLKGDTASLGRLENWLCDWVKKNPVNYGINWKCGQEAAFRSLNLLVTSLILGEKFHRPSSPLQSLLDCHLGRIAPTTSYAKAQNNNHGVSEAAALFLAGGYLMETGDDSYRKRAGKYVARGRAMLEERVKRLILPDGTFSQFSTHYQRLVLDILSLVEMMRLQLRLPPMSSDFYKNAANATLWLYSFVDEETGHVPNLGANDGSYLFNLEGRPYHDFRPSVQLAAALFCRKRVWEKVPPHPFVTLFSPDFSDLQIMDLRATVICSYGGFAHLKTEQGYAMLRLPVYRFRPSHADGLHLDLWFDGVNWVRDSGSFSYNATERDEKYFPGTASHSSVCFDGRDHMPRLGRFLFGAWLKEEEREWKSGENRIRSAYRDYLGGFHSREVVLEEGECRVVDMVSGFKDEAVVRYHLAPEKWTLKSNTLVCDNMKIDVDGDMDITLSLVEMPESRYYLKQELLPVLEIRCAREGCVSTRFIHRAKRQEQGAGAPITSG